MNNHKYTEWMQFRVSPEEKELIKEKASSKGLSDSSFLRFRALTEETDESNKEPPLWMVKALSSFGNQLNHFQSLIDGGQHPESAKLKILMRSMERFLRRIQSHDR